MRIAVASSGLGHVSRGIEAWADDLGGALHARGERVRLFKGAGSADRPFEVVLPCLRREEPRTLRLLTRFPRPLAWRLGLGSAYGWEQTSFAWHLLSCLRREPADVLHVQDPQLALVMHRARRLGLIRTRTILAHGTEETGAFLRKLDYVQHLAPWHLEQHRAAGVWKPTWTAIPNFIDTARFQPAAGSPLRAELGIPADAVVVLTAAAIKRGHKRIDHLLSEFARLQREHPGLPVWLVVAGGWETETDELVREGTASLGDRVRFLVRFPRDRMPLLYQMADVFVLCSLFEMMPIALIEATASGLPCVVHRHPILEWMTGTGGVRVEMGAASELADELAALARDRGRRKSMGIAAREHCLRNFGRDAVVGQILEYYSQVIGSSRKGAMPCG